MYNSLHMTVEQGSSTAGNRYDEPVSRNEAARAEVRTQIAQIEAEINPQIAALEQQIKDLRSRPLGSKRQLEQLKEERAHLQMLHEGVADRQSIATQLEPGTLAANINATGLSILESTTEPLALAYAMKVKSNIDYIPREPREHTADAVQRFSGADTEGNPYFGALVVEGYGGRTRFTLMPDPWNLTEGQQVAARTIVVDHARHEVLAYKDTYEMNDRGGVFGDRIRDTRNYGKDPEIDVALHKVNEEEIAGFFEESYEVAQSMLTAPPNQV